MSEEVEEVEERQRERWRRHATLGSCEYCAEDDVFVMTEPFGQRPACKPCWEQIVFGEGE